MKQENRRNLLWKKLRKRGIRYLYKMPIHLCDLLKKIIVYFSWVGQEVGEQVKMRKRTNMSNGPPPWAARDHLLLTAWAKIAALSPLRQNLAEGDHGCSRRQAPGKGLETVGWMDSLDTKWLRRASFQSISFCISHIMYNDTYSILRRNQRSPYGKKEE